MLRSWFIFDIWVQITKTTIEWDIATAKNVLKAKSELEINETPFLRKIADAIDEKEASIKTAKQNKYGDRVHKKIE
jgi:hypothetical protein